MRILTPGPVTYHSNLANVPQTAHTSPLFREAIRRVQEGLEKVFGATGFTAALTGSGSWGAEVGVWNLVRPGSRVLVLSQGLFGMRLAEMMHRRGAEVHVLSFERLPWGDLEEALTTLRPEVVGMVHVDTSTGLSLPYLEVAELVRQVLPETLVILDTVASAGAVPLRLEGLVDYAFTASQKGLEAPAGLAPIYVSARGMARLVPSPSWYGDLKLVHGFWEKGEYHHTPAVPLVLALDKAIARVLSEGLEEREKRSREAYTFLQEALKGEFDFPPKDLAAPTVAVLYPKRESPGAVLGKLAEAGFLAAPGIGPTKDRAVRIGLFGAQAKEAFGVVEALLGRSVV